MTKRPNIECPTCGGSGSAKLPEDLSLMLQEFKGARRITAQEFEAMSNGAIKSTAFNNRLEKLRAFGFLSREKKGKTFFYFKSSK